jgi:DNA helicase HerA-like ATPase
MERDVMIFVAQFPTQVAPEIIKNSGVRIVHRIAWAGDLRLVGEALNLTERQLQYVGSLGTGEAVVSLTRLQRPVLVQVKAQSFLPPDKSNSNLSGES